MRNRHFPRLCPSCGGPMARQEDTCWRCGAPWATHQQRATTLRADLPAVLQVPRRQPPVAAGGIAETSGAANLDADRWVDEGGTLAPERALVAARSGRSK